MPTHYRNWFKNRVCWDCIPPIACDSWRSFCRVEPYQQNGIRKPLNCLSSLLFSGYATFCRKSFTTWAMDINGERGYKGIKAVTRTCQYLLQVWHLQFFKMLLENKELTFESHYILESSSFLRDWFNPTVLIHRVQTLSWTKNPGIFHGGIESLFWNSRTSNKVCSNSCFREFTTTVTSPHIILECPSSLPPQHTPPSLGEYSIMTQPCNLEKLTKGLF